MVLHPVEFFGFQGFGVQAVVDVAIESQHRLAGVLGGRLGLPGLVAGHVEARQRVAQAHELGNLLRRLVLQDVNQLRRLRHKQRLGVGHVAQGGVVIQRLGR